MKSIAKLLQKNRRRIVGLMSGTSADGVDAALIDVETLKTGSGSGLSWELLDFITVPFPPAVRAEILAVQEGTERVLPRLTRLHFLLGHLYADAVETLIKDAGTPLPTVDAVACHGQTVCHFPRFEKTVGDARAEAGGTSFSTLQIGEPTVLAERLHLPVVSNFRSRDVAAGGTGAPLVPRVDHLLYADPSRSRLALNIGGIANLTAIRAGAGLHDVMAFDTGPGNMVIDTLVPRVTEGAKQIDAGGAMARRGTPDREIVERILEEEPYFRLAPPKAAGREQFGNAFAELLLERCRKKKLSPGSILSTAAWLTARSVWDAYRRFVAPGFAVEEVVVSGGGAHNIALLEYLSSTFEGIRVVTSDYYGLDVDAKEAVAFALLAHLSLEGRAGNVPSVTGARFPVVLGTVTPGDHLE